MSRTHLESLPVHLAENLRRVREQRDLTQGGLAKLCGVPRSTIANIETGAGNPTLQVLARLSLALQQPLEELLSPPKARVELFQKGKLPVIDKGRGAARVAKLLPHVIPGMEIDRMELVPGGRMTGVPHRPGTHEYLCCERGRLALLVAGERLQLSPGDVAAFAADQRHSYENPGRSPAVAFSVVALAPIGSG